jgi:hypothetical protein
MAKSIRVTMTRPNLDTVWPFDINPWGIILQSNFSAGEQVGIQTWILGNEDTDLTLVVDHYFSDDADFESLKDIAYTKIPLWIDDSNRTEANEYHQANNITVEIVEVSNPDLSAYTRILEERDRTLDAVKTLY